LKLSTTHCVALNRGVKFEFFANSTLQFRRLSAKTSLDPSNKGKSQSKVVGIRISDFTGR